MLSTCPIHAARYLETGKLEQAFRHVSCIPRRLDSVHMHSCMCIYKQLPICFPVHSLPAGAPVSNSTDYCSFFYASLQIQDPEVSHYHHCSKERCGKRECLQEHLFCGDNPVFTGICEQDWTCAGAFQIWQHFEIKCLKNLSLQQPCLM